MSLQKLGKVDIDGLWRLREVRLPLLDVVLCTVNMLLTIFQAQGDIWTRFRAMHKSVDLEIVTADPWYYCEPGTEYLVSDPIEVPGMADLLGACMSDNGSSSNVVFATPASDLSEFDPFSQLSFELCQMLIDHLSRADVASMRSVSKRFTQLPQSYFRRLVDTEMPWIWELDTAQTINVDWYKLWCRLFEADGGTGTDEKERGSMRRTGQWQSRLYGADSEPQAELKARYEAIMWPLKNDLVLSGLRNRRRIWQDIQEMVRRIERLPPDDG